MTKQQTLILVVLVALGAVFFILKPDHPPLLDIETRNEPRNTATTSLSNLLSGVSIPSLKLPSFGNKDLEVETWTTFQNYLAAAKAHDLPTIKRLSHQISATCADPEQEENCFALMDSVYTFGNSFKAEQFRHTEYDDKQVVIYTDGPERTFIFFSRVDGELKILAMRVCFDNVAEICIGENIDKTDTDKDGWWDITESLFR